MEFIQGALYFLKDDFFDFVQEDYLKKNYSQTKRPHYFAVRDNGTGLLWMVPCSSRVEKYEALIRKKQAQHKPTNTIKIVTIFNKKSVLLFQDMFPVSEQYVDGPYIKGGQLVRISDPLLQSELEENARKIMKKIRHHVRFTPTQPDAMRIEQLLLKEST